MQKTYLKPNPIPHHANARQQIDITAPAKRADSSCRVLFLLHHHVTSHDVFLVNGPADCPALSPPQEELSLNRANEVARENKESKNKTQVENGKKRESIVIKGKKRKQKNTSYQIKYKRIRHR